MNAENFADIIRNPSQLYQLSYQELKSLVLQYPFCRNLHYLLLLKSLTDNQKDFERVLEKTAAYSLDRRYLYQQLRAVQGTEELVEHFEFGEETLELEDLLQLEPELRPFEFEELSAGLDEEQDQEIIRFEEPLPAASAQTDEFSKLEKALEQRQQRPAEVPLPPVEEEANASPILAGEDIIANYSACLELLESWQPPNLIGSAPAPAPRPEMPPQPRPKPKSAFSSWNQQQRMPLPGVPAFSNGSLNGHHDPLSKKNKPESVAEFAGRSLRMNKEVVSETLAELLVNQERYEKAIQMYQRLILIFPEKSGYFAGKIEQLKKFV